ncbi:type II toxin-antitoxin system prevent-host-death family antitoxin [Candidatus Tisiphia endosymbiont of Ditula angustiorana]|uniref:type II toxin-antitoxin system prevent-host-death family antitoxin n=1 Tax=Candidatus Tisiphia endosymbiont of Ditula angustiorana TaxID=3066272 RepID=UPI00312CAB8B
MQLKQNVSLVYYLVKVQTEPISISRNGKPIAVIVSDKEFQELESFKEQVLKLAISAG